MKVALIGATGFVGKAVLHELLNRNHQVTSIARNLENQETIENLTTVGADVNNTGELAAVLKGHEAVVSAFNAGWTNPNLYNDYLAGARSIQAATKAAGVGRLIAIGGAGSLFASDGLQLIDTPQFPQEYKQGAGAARDYLNILRKEDQLEWTFVSPAIEMHPGTSGVRKGQYRSGLENPVVDQKGRSVISVEDFAAAIVDELETPAHVRGRFTVAY